MKFLGINLTKYVQDSQAAKFKMLMKQIKDDINKWIIIPYSWTEDSI